MQPPDVYPNWAECAVDASLKSVELLQKEGRDAVNQHRLAVKFGCYQVNDV